MISNLADLMCHRTQTAAKCYRMVNREKTCVAAAKTLSDLSRISVNEKHLSRNEQTEDCACVAQWLGRRSLARGLSLIYA